MGMKPCPGCGMPRDEKQASKVPCPICSLSPPPAVDPDPEGWGVDGGRKAAKAAKPAKDKDKEPAAPAKTPPPPAADRPAPPALPRAARPRPGGGSRTWVAVAAGVLLLAGVGGAVLLLRGKSKPDGEENTAARGDTGAGEKKANPGAKPGGGSGAPVPPPAALPAGPEVVLTSSTALTPAAFGQTHVCGGTTADYTVTLPPAAGHAGKSLWVRMSPALTKFVTVSAGAAGTIDGQRTRLMWAQEAALLVTDGTNWFKIAGKSRPMAARVGRVTDIEGGGIAAGTVTFVPLDKVRLDNTGRMADTANGVIRIPRPGLYQCTGSITYASAGGGAALGPADNIQTRIHTDASTVIAATSIASATGGFPCTHASVTAEFNPTDDVRLFAFHTSAGAGGIFSSGSLDVNWLSVVEVPQW